MASSAQRWVRRERCSPIGVLATTTCLQQLQHPPAVSFPLSQSTAHFPRTPTCLSDYAAAGAKGVRCYPSMHYNTTPQQLEPLCAAAQASGLVVTLAMRPIMDWSFAVAAVGPFEYLFAQYPGVQFVLHGLNYGEETWSGIRLNNAHPNVWLETSCLQGLGGIAQLVAQAAVDRVLLGVGIPLQYPACGIAKLEKAEISASAREAIAHLNARRLFGAGS